METAQEVKIAPGSPRSGKGADFRCTLMLSLENRAEMVEIKHSVTLGARGPWAEKQKAPSYESGTHNLETGGLIGAPLNGKRFWRKRSNHTQRSTRSSRGERKTIVIVGYQSSKSTALGVRMTLDLEEPRSDS